MTHERGDVSSDGADEAISRAFGLSENDDAWLAHARRATRAPSSLGRIGPYELLAEVGHGGQGTVYTTAQPGTGRIVALKRVARAGLSAEERELFPREVAAVTRLEHPNVVTVHGAEVIDGHAILVMQFVEGDAIDRWADAARERNDWLPRVLSTFALACDGVAHAHQRGVIHRDIKPSNILVDADDMPRVVDFGIARLCDEASAAAPDARSTMGFAGTPLYAAPERLAGRPADTRGDVYSLGVLLYRMLAGATPFTETGGLRDLLDAVGSGAIARPSAVRSDLPADLDWIVLKAMSVEPAQRYQSVSELAHDVRAFVVGEAISAHPPTMAYRLRVLGRRHGWAIAGAALIVVALVTATIVSWRSAVRAEEGRAMQVEVVGVLSEILTDDPLMPVRDAIDRASESLLRPGAQPKSPVVEAALRVVIGRTYLNMGRIEPAERQLTAALALQTAQYGERSPEVLLARYYLARVARAQGKLEEAATMLRDIIAQCRLGGDKYEEPMAQSLTSLGITMRHLKRFDDAETALREALAIYTRRLGPMNENVGQTASSLGTLLGSLGRLEEAEQFGRQALAVARANYTDHPNHDLAQIMCSLGDVLCKREKREEGEALIREGLSMHRAISGEGHILSAYAAVRLSRELMRRGDAEAAVTLLQSGFNALKASQPRGSTSVVEAAELLRTALRAAGRDAEAEQVSEEAGVANP